MKKIHPIFVLICMLASACSQNPQNTKILPTQVGKPTDTAAKEIMVAAADKSKIGKPIYPAADILKNFGTFWAYYSQNVLLNEDFKPSNSLGKTINKTAFLTQLKTGKYIPLQVYADSSRLAYQLYKLPGTAEINIDYLIREEARKHLTYYRMEGKKIPSFNFTTINGETYTPENTKGKIVLLKCWFIGCVACVAEMPGLNKLVEKYRNRKDILFISLAFDGKKELQQFLSKTKFDYATVPKQESYMTNQLHVSSFPTHLLIDKEGKLVQVSGDADQIERSLAKEITKTKI